MASTQILLNSRLPGSERSFADSSGLLGHYIMDHVFRTGFWGTVPDPALEPYIAYGRRPNGVYIPRFRNLNGQDADADFVRGYGMQGAAGRSPAGAGGFGKAMKEAMRGYGPWTIRFTAFAECLPYKDNTMTLNPAKLDRYGVPLAVFNVTFRDNEMKMMRDAALQGEAMMKAAGLTDVGSSNEEHVPGDAIHEMGGACMGDDPQQLGGQSLEPVARRGQCLRHRWVADGVHLLRQSLHDLHGADGARRRSCREAGQGRHDLASIRLLYIWHARLFSGPPFHMEFLCGQHDFLSSHSWRESSCEPSRAVLPSPITKPRSPPPITRRAIVMQSMPTGTAASFSPLKAGTPMPTARPGK